MSDTPVLPALVDADLPGAVRLLAWTADEVDRDGDGSLADLRTERARVIAAAGTDQLGCAVRVWHDLVAATVTAEHAAALPEAPFRGPDGGRWHSDALAHLPARVVLAGPDVVRAVLAGSPAGPTPATPGLPEVPDVRQRAAWQTRESADEVAAAWVDRTTRGRRRAADGLAELAPALDPRRRLTTFWGPWDLGDEWQVDVGWNPFVAVGPADRDAELFTAAAGPLSFTSRYPSTMTQARWGRRPQVLRSVWLGVLEGLLETWVQHLGHDLAGLTGSPDDRMTTTVPPEGLVDRPLATVELRTSSGLSVGGLRGGRGALPPPGGALPPPQDATASSTELTETVVVVRVDLPSRDLPPLEDTVAGVLRVFAHRLLTDVPDVTPHAREVLAAWRDRGPGGPGGPNGSVTTLADDVDAAVGFARARGVELS